MSKILPEDSFPCGLDGVGGETPAPEDDFEAAIAAAIAAAVARCVRVPCAEAEEEERASGLTDPVPYVREMEYLVVRANVSIFVDGVLRLARSEKNDRLELFARVRNHTQPPHSSHHV